MAMTYALFRRSSTAAAVLVVLSLAACSRSPSGPEPKVKVTEITVGRALAPDDTIVEDSRTTNFWTTDTFYVSVKAEPNAAPAADGGPPSGTLKARWTFQDGSVAAESEEKTITPTGPTTVAFQASKPNRWNAGDYKVEILVDGQPAGSKDLNAR